MNSKYLSAAQPRAFTSAAAIFLIAAFAAVPATSAFAQSPTPTFTKTFAPDTIGPGSASLLTFTITNGSGAVVSGLAFTDNLPAGVTVADPAVPAHTCDAGTLSAPDGGGLITFTDGELAAGATCTVSVLVTSSVVGTHMNTSSDLTSSAGNSGTATDDLDVVNTRPGFSKSFAPSSGPLGNRSTLTFTIDNTLNSSRVGSLDFTDNLPTGIVVADPSNASTNCVAAMNPNTTITAVPGTSAVILDANGANFSPGFEVLSDGAICTVTVDVVSEGLGFLDNVSGDLQADFTPAGRAVDTLESTVTDIALVKEFIADPVPPGGTVDLEFTILNRTRSDNATGVSFTDNLDATLSGLVPIGLPAAACGGTVGFTSPNLEFSGGNVAAASECSFTVAIQVPAAATPGVYPNTTTAVTANLGGSPVIGNQASDDLFVFAAPLLEKTFLDNPAAAGGTTRMEFTITNTSSDPATGIDFTDDLVAFLGVAPAVSNLPAAGFCGGSSTISYFAGSGILNIADASLAALDSCTFEATVEIPVGFPGGIYTNGTSDVSATVGPDEVAGASASADLEVVAAPVLTKAFTDDPVLPGSTVTLEFTLGHDEFAPTDATSITFTDDIGATLTGLTALSLPANDVCGIGSQLSESSNVLELTGGTLAPGSSCTFPVTLQVPMGANPGTYPNSTSEVTATVSGLTATGLAATDDLLVTGLSFGKEFIDDPVIAGDTAILRFTLRNDGSLDASGIGFTDVLDATLAGLTVTNFPSPACGGTVTIGSTATLVFSSGSLLAGASCSFDITVQIPAGTADGPYPNATSSLSASEGGSSVTLPPATDDLLVDSTLLSLSKEFLDDPVTPGATANLQFTLENNSGNTATDITFTDDLDAALSGLQVTGPIPLVPCGAGSSVSGGSLLTFSGGNLAANDSCTFQLTVEVPAAAPAGLYTNTTSDATGDVGGLTVTGLAASDAFRVVATTFTKSFNGPSVAGGTPVLSFTLTNLDATNGVGALAFTDNLDDVITGLVATGLPLNDICGTGSSISGTGLLTFSGGNLAAAGSPGDACTFQVPLSVPGMTAPGGYPNITSNLTSAGLVTNDPATATLVIEPPPTFAKVFNPTAIAVNGTSTLTFTINNAASMLAASGLDFTDNLPAGLEVAAMPNASTTCTGGTLSATAGSGTISYTGGEVAANASCTIQVDVTGTAEGTFDNISSALNSSSGNSGTASDTIDVVSGDFVVTKSFQTAPVLPAGLVNLELTITNGSAFPLTDIALSDDLDATLTGLAAEGLPLADVCGTGSQATGTSTVALAGGNLAAGGSCTVVISVRVPGGTTAGTFPNTTSVATGTREGLPVQADPDSADLIVEPLGFAKSFDPALVAVGGTTTAIFEITNPDPANAVSGLTFSDDLEAFVPDMTAANTPIADACGGASLVDGTSTITLTGGAIAAGGSCTIQVVLNIPAGTPPGDFTNTTSALTGAAGSVQTSAAAASGVIDVQPPPAFSKAFSPDAILPGDTSTLTFIIDNTASQLDADSLAFDDNLPAGMVVAPNPIVANTCGGTLTAAPGNGLIQFSGGSVAPGVVCQIQIDVAVDTSGTFTNITDDLTSSVGNSGSATAVLTVSQAIIPVPLFNIAWLALLSLLLAAFGWKALNVNKP